MRAGRRGGGRAQRTHDGRPQRCPEKFLARRGVPSPSRAAAQDGRWDHRMHIVGTICVAGTLVP
eukprot:8579702-Alexandrium_andersonii.AAC.1